MELLKFPLEDKETLASLRLSDSWAVLVRWMEYILRAQARAFLAKSIDQTTERSMLIEKAQLEGAQKLLRELVVSMDSLVRKAKQNENEM